MKHKELFKLLDDIKEEENVSLPREHDRVLLIDGLNLFFRNFAMLNIINPEGIHIGGLGGFLRSLGSLIKQIQPTAVYVVFDGAGSSNNRKNLLPEYKSLRNIQRITNWEVFENLDEEHDSKIDQIVRLIQYLKQLPVKTISIDKVEADDIISVLSTYLPAKFNSNVFIVSSDQDFVQLVNNKVVLYRPIEKEYYTPQTVFDKYKVKVENFILYKTLLGDNSDKVPGIKGLGEKGILKRFPELQTQILTLDDIFDISAVKFKENIIYSRIINEQKRLETSFKIMNLSKPMVDNNDIAYISEVVKSNFPELNSSLFKMLYDEDKLGGIIRNVDIYLKDNFFHFKGYKK
jgi:DNA polymerase-1